MAVAAAVGIGSLALGAFSAFEGHKEARRMRRAIKARNAIMRKQLKFAQDRWNDYNKQYGAITKKYVADAMHGVTGDYTGVANRAATDVASQFDNQQDEQRRRLMAYGLDPSSGRYQSTDRQAGLQEAATSALAQNRARNAERGRVESTNLNLASGAAHLGANVLQNSANSLQNAQSQLASAYGGDAQRYGQLSNNLFANAGQLGVFGGLTLAKGLSAPTSSPSASGLNYDFGNTQTFDGGINQTGISDSLSGLNMYDSNMPYGAYQNFQAPSTQYGLGLTGRQY